MISLLIETTLRSLLLGIGVALALAVLRIRSPHLKKSAWTAVLVSALLIPLLMRAHGPVIQTPSYLLTLTPVSVSGVVSSPMRPSLAVLYGAVALLLLVRYAASLTRLMRIRRRARHVSEPWAAGFDVRATTELSSPATFGGTILLPEEHVEWGTRKREAIMAHERSHVLAHDCQRLWLAKLYKSLFWLNPLAWWLERRIASLAEETSDAAALKAVGDAPGYAEILLEFAAAAGRMPTVATGMGSPRIAARIERIVSGKAAADRPRMWRRFADVAGVVPAMLLCATLQLAPGQWTFAHGRTVMGGQSVARGPAADEPRVLAWPPQLMDFYPRQARRAGIEGFVVVAVTLDDRGQVTDTKVLSESPPNFGFGAAASAVARAMRFSNPTGHTARTKLPIKFALQHKRRRASRT